MNTRLITLVAIMAMVLINKVQGDNRSFVWTYQYQTLEAGTAEFEHYLTLASVNENRVDNLMTAEHQFELEVGMNDKFDIGIYQVFKQPAGGSLKYSAFKVRSRYKFGETNGSFVLPVLYTEYKANQDLTEQEFEIKPILGKNGMPWSTALNPVLKLEKESSEGGQWEVNFAYTAAIGYNVNPLLNVGMELQGSEHGNYLGPTIAHGREDLWIAFGSGFAIGGIVSGYDKLNLRMLIGVGL